MGRSDGATEIQTDTTFERDAYRVVAAKKKRKEHLTLFRVPFPPACVHYGTATDFLHFRLVHLDPLLSAIVTLEGFGKRSIDAHTKKRQPRQNQVQTTPNPHS